MNEERLALDTRKWLPKSHETQEYARKRAAEDLGFALREQKDTPELEDTINSFTLLVNSLGHLEHPVFGEVRNFLRHETESDILENEAFDKIESWAASNQKGSIIWISPPSDKFGYTESRFVVGERDRIKGKKAVIFKAIRGLHSRTECNTIAEQLSAFSPVGLEPILDNSDLRRTPIPFEPPEAVSWVDFLQQVIYMPKVWDAIRRGDDIVGTQEAQNAGAEIIKATYSEILIAETSYDHLRVGSSIELGAQRVGYMMQKVGSCGISNIEALRKQGPLEVFFNGLETSSGGNWKYELGICRVCNNFKGVGPCSICKECERFF
jgi:hypothetical protein